MMKYFCKVYIHGFKVKPTPTPAQTQSFVGFKDTCYV